MCLRIDIQMLLGAAKQSHPPSKTVGCLSTTQALRASAGKSTWGRAKAPQVGLYRVLGWWCGYPKSHLDPQPLVKHGQQFDICFPSYYQVYTHTIQSKAYSSHVKHSHCRPVNQHWDGCAPLRHSSLVQANLPGAGLVTRRRTVQVSQLEVVEPKVPQQPHTAKQDKDSWAFASPVYTRYPLMLQLGGLLRQLTPGHHCRSPFIQLGRLEHCE